MAKTKPTTRRGMSLLELLVATALMATVVTAVSVVIRTSYAAWQAHEQDADRLQAAQATVRHVVRNLRQATAVTAISAANDTSGAISIQNGDGTVLVWDHDGATQAVNFGVSGAPSLLAENISQLRFVGYAADGVTTTTIPEEIQAVRCTASTILPRGAGAQKAFSSWVWIRSW